MLAWVQEPIKFTNRSSQGTGALLTGLVMLMTGYSYPRAICILQPEKFPVQSSGEGVLGEMSKATVVAAVAALSQ